MYICNMENTMKIENLVKHDGKTSWNWDFTWNGHKVWIVAEKHADSNWLENKHGELVGVAEWVSRFFVDGEEIQSMYSTQKWDSWENRAFHLKCNYEEKEPVVSEAVKKAQKKVAKVKEEISGLNEKELAVLEHLVWNTSNQGGDFGFTDEVIEEGYAILKMSKPEVKGYIGSIKKKGLVWIDTTDNGYQQFGFTDKGFEVLSNLGPKYLMF